MQLKSCAYNVHATFYIENNKNLICLLLTYTILIENNNYMPSFIGRFDSCISSQNCPYGTCPLDFSK